MSTQRDIARDAFEQVYMKLNRLEQEIQRLKEKPYLTSPRYDWSNPPQDALEDQIVIFENVPTLSDF